MTVNLAGSLPKDDLNGLSPVERTLARERHEDRRYLVVGVMETKGAKEAAPDWTPQPIMHLTHVELAGEKYSEQVGQILISLYQERTGRVGLDFPWGESEPERLQITAESGYKFKVTMDENGSFSIELLNSSDQVIGARHALRGAEFDDLDFAVGAFDLAALPPVLQPYAKTLLAEWGMNADDADDVVDAEVVDGGDDE